MARNRKPNILMTPLCALLMIASVGVCIFPFLNLQEGSLLFSILSPMRTFLDSRVNPLAASSLSAYGLIPEEGTLLAARLESGVLKLPDPETERDMYDLCIRRLAENGLMQYEISNFARLGMECRHNIGYWDQVPYLGLGIAAASMLRPASLPEEVFSIRRTNPESFAEYFRMLSSPDDFTQNETISPAEARFETVMLSLRMTAGMNRQRFTELHGAPPERFYGDILSRLEKQGLLILRDDSWCLTRRGMDIQNSVLLEFMEDRA